jgi:carbon-monoxide dehydrogenase medium subunit
MIRDFDYHRVKTVEDALELLAKYQDDYKIICGGQSLLILMRQGLVAPENLIDIKGVDELDYIVFDPKEGLKIGATTTHSSVEKSPLVKEHYPILVSMEKNLASIQTRNWGTIGGNLCHGDPTGDPGNVFIALNGTVKLANKERERTLPLEGFFVDYFETELEEGEMLLEVQLPVIPPRTAVTYDKFNIIENDQGIVAVAVSVTADEKGSECQDARIVLGSAAPVSMRAKEAEKLLVGNKADDKLLESVGKKAAEEADPVADIHASEEYRRELVETLTKRMVKRAWEEARALAKEKE